MPRSRSKSAMTRPASVLPRHGVEGVGAFGREDLAEREGRERSQQRVGDQRREYPRADGHPLVAPGRPMRQRQEEARQRGHERNDPEDVRVEAALIAVGRSRRGRADDFRLHRNRVGRDHRRHRADRNDAPEERLPPDPRDGVAHAARDRRRNRVPVSSSRRVARKEREGDERKYDRLPERASR